jgi:hypothetical protein
LTGLTDRLEALGGRIEIESPLGVGTRIESQIPVADTAERGTKPGEARWSVPMPSSSR